MQAQSTEASSTIAQLMAGDKNQYR